MQDRRRQPDAYFEGSGRYKEPKTGLMVVNVHAGDCYVSGATDEIGATVLGSCISACIRDPLLKIGGMNHFLLPGEAASQNESARFGAFAMEQLINEILKRGGKRERLEVKIFGGGNVIASSALVGTKNINFVKQYLLREDMQIVAEHVGGKWPRKVRYQPNTGKAMVRVLQRDDDFVRVRREEEQYRTKIIKTEDDDVELF